MQHVIFKYIEDIPFFLMNKSYISSSEADNSYFSNSNFLKKKFIS